jgi:glutathione S-transferase
MRLYDNPISGNCYKVRLLLALIGKEYEQIPVDSLRGETRQAPFLAISARGLIPVLEDNGEVIADSMAILTYLARRYAPEWLPDTPLGEARVAEWLAVAADELQYGAATARRIKKLGVEGDLKAAQQQAIKGLALLESRLAEHSWLAAEKPTVADIACYPYVALLPEGGVELTPYPAISQWIARIQALPGYLPMPGL